MALKLATVIKQMRSFRNPYAYESLEVLHAGIKPSPGAKSIYSQCLVNGKGDTYKNYIQFFDVKFQENAEQGLFSAKVGRKDYYYPPVTANNNRCKFYCNCPDMQFTFSYQLWEKDSFIGAYKRYKRVPGSTRPPRNPKNVPGFCKHTMSHLNQLKKMGFITGF
jgi:hypothetical protein